MVKFAEIVGSFTDASLLLSVLKLMSYCFNELGVKHRRKIGRRIIDSYRPCKFLNLRASERSKLASVNSDRVTFVGALLWKY